MMNTTWFWTLFAVSAATWVIIIILKTFTHNKSGNKKLPPGPKGLPIIGHLHLIGKNPHIDLAKLSQKHGPIMHLRFGMGDNIVVSSPRAAEQFLRTHDLNFATRPPQQAAKHMSYNQKDMAFGEYGPFWRNMRKLATLELLSTHKINSFKSMRREELSLLVQSLKQGSQGREAVDLSARVSSMSVDMSCRMVFGKKYEDKDIGDKGFKAVVQESVHLTALPNLGDFFPFLSRFDLQGLTRRMKAVAEQFDQFFERIIDEHEQAHKKQGNNARASKDFVDTMLEIFESGQTSFEFTREHIKSMMLDMLVTSMDTSSSVIEWTMTELLRHPEVMKKLQRELERHVGLNRMVEEEDLDKLEYLEFVVKESLRIHPGVPLLIPHATIEDCEVEGYHIPKHARLTVNAWAIGHDPNVWRDPERFQPERFEGVETEYRGQHFELIPFGSGRRSCPGINLGVTVVKFVVAQLVHCFDWELPNGMLPKDLDMTEKFGIVVSRANHLMATPTYRLNV